MLWRNVSHFTQVWVVNSWSVSDLKLYEIQASRACNFIKFQVRLESSRPHKSLCQQNSCQRYLKIHILNNVDNLVITACFMNLIIFRIWLSLLTLLFLITLAYADTHFCSKDFYNMKYFFSSLFSSSKCPSVQHCPVSTTGSAYVNARNTIFFHDIPLSLLNDIASSTKTSSMFW